MASRLLGGGRRRCGRSRLVMMVVMMMVHRSRLGRGRRSGFLRHGVAGEAQREHGGG